MTSYIKPPSLLLDGSQTVYGKNVYFGFIELAPVTIF